MSVIEYVVIGLIVAGAVAYIGLVIFKKTRSMSSKNDCGSDCGCDN
ncbi:MAG: FeoB-associated Cys-rich membrane protein [Acidobacteria bacterium]|nr:FeoB-associated Cys-rich membrane protein [Acidobacteriota bacterium]